ncbi:MAG: AzlD domain-containing protein [Magnetovibrionaceae bacterium]
MNGPDPLYIAGALAVGALATYAWRAIGVALGQRVKVNSPVLDWVGCVAIALIAGLVARMILLPNGPLVDTPLELRLVGTAVTVGLFFLVRRNVGLALALAIPGFMGLIWFWQLV